MVGLAQRLRVSLVAIVDASRCRCPPPRPRDGPRSARGPAAPHRREWAKLRGSTLGLPPAGAAVPGARDRPRGSVRARSQYLAECLLPQAAVALSEPPRRGHGPHAARRRAAGGLAGRDPPDRRAGELRPRGAGRRRAWNGATMTWWTRPPAGPSSPGRDDSDLPERRQASAPRPRRSWPLATTRTATRTAQPTGRARGGRATTALRKALQHAPHPSPVRPVQGLSHRVADPGGGDVRPTSPPWPSARASGVTVEAADACRPRPPVLSLFSMMRCWSTPCCRFRGGPRGPLGPGILITVGGVAMAAGRLQLASAQSVAEGVVGRVLVGAGTRPRSCASCACCPCGSRRCACRCSAQVVGMTGNLGQLFLRAALRRAVAHRRVGALVRGDGGDRQCSPRCCSDYYCATARRRAGARDGVSFSAVRASMGLALRGPGERLGFLGALHGPVRGQRVR
ncbi:hypothetical protein QJS66_05045 [Kocuria rhizophila]|nr:hypothetical protein QJS66_05045 [Kocuria rhizophila]